MGIIIIGYNKGSVFSGNSRVVINGNGDYIAGTKNIICNGGNIQIGRNNSYNGRNISGAVMETTNGMVIGEGSVINGSLHGKTINGGLRGVTINGELSDSVIHGDLCHCTINGNIRNVRIYGRYYANIVNGNIINVKQQRQ